MNQQLHPEQLRALDYLSRKGSLASVDRLRQQLRDAFAAVEEMFDQVAAGLRDAAPAPAKWSPHDILDHLVLSHGPAIPQLASLLRGISPPGVAIPADLQSPAGTRADWEVLRAALGKIHQELLELVAAAGDDQSLEPKAMVEIVIKVNVENGSQEPVHWLEPLDWKALVQSIRVHTVEHQKQLQRAM
jgi:hypothetical protein